MYHPRKNPEKENNTTIVACRHLTKPGELLDLIKQHTLSVSSIRKGNPVKLISVREDNGQFLVN